MSWLGELILNLHNWRNGVAKIKSTIVKSTSPLRFGILGAAEINYGALIDPIQTHPDVILTGIAARSKAKAEAQIQKYSLGPQCKAYGSYDDLLNSTDIDAVYIPLPNGLHAEWAVAAMQRGKHVLIEKPIASNALEARRIKDIAEQTGRVALEAFHWRFHPLSIRVKKIIDSGKYGNVLSMKVLMTMPRGVLGADDIRFNYSLAGGANMDLTYVYSACRYLTGEIGDIHVINAKARLNQKDNRIDDEMVADFVIERDGKPLVECHTRADAANPPLLGIIPKLWEAMPHLTIQLEKGKIEFPGYVQPAYASGITIQEKDENGKLVGKPVADKDMLAGYENSYGECGGQAWWTTYRWQLEAFVGKVRSVQRGETWEGPWMTIDQSVGQMETIDAVYDKAELPRRGT